MDLKELKLFFEAFEHDLAQESSVKGMDECRVKHLGAKSPIRLALRAIKTLPQDQQKPFAMEANRLASQMEADFQTAKEALKQKIMADQIHKEWIDLSLPSTTERLGKQHPVKRVESKCLNYLMQLGFELADGNEIENAYHNFDALNIPAYHPARDLQDTFWLSDEWLLRTHTTSVQSRVLSERPDPPIKKVVVGRVYRNEAVDATHLAMFHQLDGFWVEAGLTLAHLKGIVTFLAHQLYGANQAIRFKPKYYPYTEPSVGVDVACSVCSGNGCSACHQLGWVTIMGAGMIHPSVLKEFGYDPKKISGIAFGWGLSRMTTQFFKLSKLRPLYVGDLRFLRALS